MLYIKHFKSYIIWSESMGNGTNYKYYKCANPQFGCHRNQLILKYDIFQNDCFANVFLHAVQRL